jgi:hypothetical protein
MWIPLLISSERAPMLRTPPLPDIDALAAAVDDLAEKVERTGRRADEVGVQVEGPGSDVLRTAGSLDAHVDFLDQLAKAGVQQFVIDVPSGGLTEATEAMDRYGSEVIAAQI